MSFDVIADLFCSLNNAKIIGKALVIVPNSKIKINILKVLKEECVISDFVIVERNINVTLQYVKGVPTFEKIVRISKSSLRVYKKTEDILKIKGGRGFFIVSTSKKGIISSYKSAEESIGGEILGMVY